MKTSYLAGLAVCLVIVCTAAMVSAAPYILTDLGTLEGGASTEAVDINNNGQVVGNCGSHAFLYSGATMIDLGVHTSAAAINDKGQVVGYSGDRSKGWPYYAFVYSNGTMSIFETPSIATGINNNGQVVGYSIKPLSWGYTYNAYLYSDGVMNDIGQGTIYSMANAINNSGQVAGYNVIGYDNAFLYSSGQWNYKNQQDLVGYAINDIGQVVGEDGQNAFLYSDGVTTRFGNTGVRSIAFGVNDSGLVVGRSQIEGSQEPYAFLYEKGNMRDLNDLVDPAWGWTLWSANAINDKGVIVGAGIDASGLQRAFLLTPTGEPFPPITNPVPEPATLLLLGTGIVGLIATRRGNKHWSPQVGA